MTRLLEKGFTKTLLNALDAIKDQSGQISCKKSGLYSTIRRVQRQNYENDKVTASVDQPIVAIMVHSEQNSKTCIDMLTGNTSREKTPAVYKLVEMSDVKVKQDRAGIGRAGMLLWLAKHLISNRKAYSFEKIKNSFMPNKQANDISGISSNYIPISQRRSVNALALHGRFNNDGQINGSPITMNLPSSSILLNLAGAFEAGGLTVEIRRLVDYTPNDIRQSNLPIVSEHADEIVSRQSLCLARRDSAMLIGSLLHRKIEQNLRAGMTLARENLQRSSFEARMKAFWIQQIALAKQTDQNRVFLRSLVKRLRQKVIFCLKMMRDLHLTPFDNGVGLMPYIQSSRSKPEILDSLHQHWLKVTRPSDGNQPTDTFGIIEKQRTSLKISIGSSPTMNSESWRSQLQVGINTSYQNLSSFAERLVEKLVTKLANSLKHLRSQSAALTILQKADRISPKITPQSKKSEVTMDSSRVALLATYFGSQKIMSLSHKKLLSAFHDIRRHSAVESYRGFYGNWWKWKVSNIQAKHYLQLKEKRTGITEEKSLRLQSNEQLTKWMSFSSPKESESNGLLTARDLSSRDRLSRLTPKFSTCKSKLVPPLLFPSKKCLSNKPVVTSCSSREVKPHLTSSLLCKDEEKKVISSRKDPELNSGQLKRSKGQVLSVENHLDKKLTSSARKFTPKNRWHMQLNSKVSYLSNGQPMTKQAVYSQLLSKDASGHQLSKSSIEKVRHNGSLSLSRLPLKGRSHVNSVFKTEEGSQSQELKPERALTDANLHSSRRLRDFCLERSQLTISKRSEEHQFNFGSLSIRVKEPSSQKTSLLQIWTDKQQSRR